MVKRFEVYLVNLDPTQGREIQKTRPCVVVSPNEIHSLRTAIVAPMTMGSHAYPMRVPVTFQRKRGHIVLDQIRTVDQSRLVKRLGAIDDKTGAEVLDVLRDMFSP